MSKTDQKTNFIFQILSYQILFFIDTFRVDFEILYTII